MSKGTSAGLLESMHPQSRYKTSILARYSKVFANKVGSRWPVMFVDGYAGTGSYGDKDGSAAILLNVAGTMHQHQAEVRAVEVDPVAYAQLHATMTSRRIAGVDAQAVLGDIDQLIDGIVAESTRMSLFLFLDPCGAPISFDHIVTILGETRKDQYPPTELLLNLSGDLIIRTGGSLRSGGSWATEWPAIESALGGDWWKQVCMTHTGADLVESVTHEYARRLAEHCGMECVVVPVFEHPGHKVARYSLVYLTRNREHGVASFLDAVGRARPDFLEAADQGDGDVQMTIFGTTPQQDTFKMAKEEQIASKAKVRDNLVRIARSGEPFVPASRVAEVYGTVAGVATETQANKALDELVREHVLDCLSQSGSHRIRGTYVAHAAATTGV